MQTGAALVLLLVALCAWVLDAFEMIFVIVPIVAPAQGLAALREAIARYVAFARAVACSADDLIVTSGAQQAFDLLARALVTPGRTRVAVEDPGYPPLRAAFVAAGAQLVPVRVDAEGLRVAELPPDVRVICVTPSHQFPLGCAMSAARRAELGDEFGGEIGRAHV